MTTSNTNQNKLGQTIKSFATISASQPQNELLTHLLVTGIPPSEEETETSLKKTFNSLTQAAFNREIPSDHIRQCRRLKSGTLMVQFQPEYISEKVEILQLAQDYWKSEKKSINSNLIELADSKIYFQTPAN
eukprot:Lithocolla_globosa_v1_NODE_349_length_4370_cov_18.560371.p4 type:complete len:132 gc:universal NODE_349_length_4370_cov_18.560371:576-971(+)